MGNTDFPQGPGVHEIKVHRCAEGGLLWEAFREEGFGQLAFRTVDPGETAGGHIHPLTNEWWFIFKGEALVYFEHTIGARKGIREMIHVDASKGPRLLPLPAGTGHDIKAIGDEPVVFIFFAERIYDPETHDKEPWSWR